VLANEPRLMPHLHLSLQAMDDMVLKRMKRRHLRGDAFRTVARARAARPDVVFGADLIAGFPTESDQMFTNTLSAVNDLGLTHLHVFPYSERSGTPAAKMPSVPVSERKARARLLREAGDAALSSFRATHTGANVRVLIEKNSQGLSEHYMPAKILGGASEAEIVNGLVTGIADGALEVTRLS
jgi:threonylcarbamoyladenosine tRNA methylthiotransferase MtaB